MQVTWHKCLVCSFKNEYKSIVLLTGTAASSASRFPYNNFYLKKVEFKKNTK